MAPGADPDLRQGRDPAECAWCSAPVEADGECAECGRRQTRVCTCGQSLDPGEDPCPYCGADWAGVVKVVRRKKRRPGLRGPELLGYVAAGVFLALLLAALINSLIGGLALKSSESTELPDSPAERLALALHTVQAGVKNLGNAVVEGLGGLMPFVLAAVLGGLLGVLYYLRREGGAGGRRHDGPGDDARRRRRV